MKTHIRKEFKALFEITLITVGKLKEKFYISAAEEYKKRLGGYCKFTLLELPEVRLPEDPSPAEISAGLEKEAELIFSKIPKGAWFCVLTPEGKELSSEAFADKLNESSSFVLKNKIGFDNGYHSLPLYLSQIICVPPFSNLNLIS